MLLLIDGNALLHRCFHAMPPTIHTSKGELTNAAFGFTNTVVNLLDKWKPTHVVCTFDSPEKTFRHEQFAEYKATRMIPPPGLYEQLPRVQALLSALGIVHIAAPGYESDDLIGTFSRLAEEKGLASMIVSSDNDFVQLISPLTSFLSTAKGMAKAEVLTPEKVIEKYGLTPNQWIDFKTLRGDPSDNLPGIPGIGAKTATTLLQKWHSLDNLNLHLDELPIKIQQKFHEHNEKALLTKSLATIHRHIPLVIGLDDIYYHGPNNKVMHELCTELEFHKLSKRFDVPEALF